MAKNINIRYIPQMEALSDTDLVKALEQTKAENVDCVNWDGYPYKPQVRLNIAFSDTNLALLYTVKEEHTLGTVLENNGPVWEDSCVETFIKDPVGEGYYNIEVNCIGTPLAAHRLSRTDFEHFGPEKMAEIRCFSSLAHEVTDLKDGEWTVCELIPFSLLGLDRAPESLETNFYKCGDNCRQPHYLSWSPIDLPDPNFHCPEFFGKINLTKDTDMNDRLTAIASQFALEGTIAEIKPLGEGFINDTFVVKTEGDAPDYILQRKNHVVFPDVPGMMDNIKAVTEHIKAKVQDPLRETLTVIPAKDGKLYVEEDGNWWAVCLFIKGTKTFDRADSPALAYQGGLGAGRFQALLADFDKPLNETIKGFHNIRWRFKQWDETIAADPAGRVKDLAEEISWIESRRKEMLDFWSLVEDGTIPSHVSHNDTKLSNILFNECDGSMLCMIDLDTVMRSTSLNDFGDAIRSYTNTGAEDDRNLDNVSMDINMFKAYAEGYLAEQKATIAQSELDHLAFSARYITFEQVLRFLMDYIDGDKYYKTAYPEHNLVRTHAQYKLLQSIEQQYEEMCNIIKNI